MKWIDIKEQFPEDKDGNIIEVIAVNQYNDMLIGYIYLDYFNEDAKEMWMAASKSDYINYITHWMPLPETPNTH